MESLKKISTFFSCYHCVFVCYFFFSIVHLTGMAKFKVKSTLEEQDGRGVGDLKSSPHYA